MTAIEIQEALKKKKITQESIAAELDPPVHPMTISKVVNKIIVSDRIMKLIASKINKKHWIVFPEYYLAPAKRSTSKVERQSA